MREVQYPEILSICPATGWREIYIKAEGWWESDVAVFAIVRNERGATEVEALSDAGDYFDAYDDWNSLVCYAGPSMTGSDIAERVAEKRKTWVDLAKGR